MRPVITFNELLELTKIKRNKSYFYVIRKHKDCFTGDVKEDVANANKIIISIINNNTAHIRSAIFKWAFDHFYGVKFNPKYLVFRSGEISKLTTRLDRTQVNYIRQKFREWIDDANNIGSNLMEHIKNTRVKLFYVFETLLCSGMRIGELTSIVFNKNLPNRIITSKISGNKLVEIIINTEKTCKMREVYIPYEAYVFFCNDKMGLNKSSIIHNLMVFKLWAKLPFKLTAHVLRRTKASVMHEAGVDVNTIAMVLGNTPNVVINHYIISSARNYDACDIANGLIDGYLVKTNNLYFNKSYLSQRKEDI